MTTQKPKRPREELIHLFKGQMRALEAFSKSFDAGEDDRPVLAEAKAFLASN